MKRYILIGSLIFCSSLGMSQKAVNSYPAPNPESVKPGAYIYSLPLTTLSFKVKVAHLSFRSGPYAQYAQKYLGITDVEQSSKDYYKILSITGGTYEEADGGNVYAADAPYGSDMSFLEMTKQGLIVPTGFIVPNIEASAPAKEMNIAPPFTDLGADPNIYKENATFFSGVKMDTSFVKIPVQKNMLVEKSAESKASDAANFIFNLRKRRVDLISGEIDNVFNNGEALKVALNEISRLEKEYLSLFIGKTYVDTLTYQQEVTPKAENGKSNSILCRYSESKGIVGEGDLSGRPLTVEVVPNNAVSQAPQNIADKGKEAIIYARYPDICAVRILDGKDILYSTKLPISQFGKIVRIPLSYPNTGKK